MTEYERFIQQKEKRFLGDGIKAKNLNPHLKDFQASIVERGLHHGRFANFSSTGMGKTLMQMEFAHQVATQKNEVGFILAPLAVSGQTILEGEKFGIEIQRFTKDTKVKRGGIYITNYEQIDNLPIDKIACIVLDESSILKSLDGKTKKKIISSFANTPFKYPCTATPSPNDPMELGNHSEFLNIMSFNEMLAMYFVHDGGDTSKWRIKKHGIRKFYQFIASFSSVVTKPSDLGFSDEGYILPPLNIHEVKITTENTGESLFNELSVSATNFNSELRRTMEQRMDKAAELIKPNQSNLIWVKHDAEADYLKKLLPSAFEVRGSQSIEEKEEKLLGFARGEFDILITKKKIAQYGLNLQICYNQIDPSPDFSFEGIFQSIRRSWRYGQTHPVDIWIFATDTMSNVIQSIKEKESKWQEMISEMVVVQTTGTGMQ